MIINPNAPDEYKYETDYRNIPREYLNPRIPEGRGIVKWRAFKTISEQYEILDQYKEDQNKVEMPLLSQEQLEEINEVVNYKITKHIVANVSYWKEGYFKSLECYIHTINTLEGLMIIKDIKSMKKESIDMYSIISVE